MPYEDIICLSALTFTLYYLLSGVCNEFILHSSCVAVIICRFVNTALDSKVRVVGDSYAQTAGASYNLTSIYFITHVLKVVLL